MSMRPFRSHTGTLVVMSGPSGAGKSSICRALIEDERVLLSVSATTRAIRDQEVDGVDYHFLSEDEFDRRVQVGDFLEHADYAGNRYGTLRAEVEQKLLGGNIVLLEIEVKGTRILQSTGLEATYVFILPPSREELGRRLRARSTDDEAAIERRLTIAREEYDAAHMYDYVIINEDLPEAIEAVRSVLGLRDERRGG